MEFDHKVNKCVIQTYAAKNRFTYALGFLFGKTLVRETVLQSKGTWTDYYENGLRVRCEEKNTAGELHGRVWTNPITGPTEETIYAAGKKHGKYSAHGVVADNCLVNREGQYKNDVKVGKWTDRLQNGVLFAENFYDRSSPLGFRLTYDKDQKPQQFTALYGDYEITLQKKGMTLRHPDIGKDDTPIDAMKVMDQMNAAYDVHRIAVTFMEETMMNEWQTVGYACDNDMHEMLWDEMKTCLALEKKLAATRDAFSKDKLKVIEKEKIDKERIKNVLTFMGKSHLVLDA